MCKKFTLVELIIVIAILGILANITIPNISNIKKDALNVQVSANTSSLQKASDIYFLNNNMKPTEIQPLLGVPQQIDISKLYPNYIKNNLKTNNIYYWIDESGLVYSSTVKPPHLKEENNSLNWDVVDKVKYNLYSDVDGKGYLNLKEKNILPPIDIVVGERYYVSSVDKNGFETPPVNTDYDPASDKAPNTENKDDPENNITYTKRNTHLYQDWIVKKELGDIVFQNKDFPKTIGDCSEPITIVTDEILNSIDGYIPEEKNKYRLRFTLEREQAIGPIYMDFMDSTTNERKELVDTNRILDEDDSFYLFEPYMTYWYGFNYDNNTKTTVDLAFDFILNDNGPVWWKDYYEAEDVRLKLCRVNNQSHGFVIRNIVVEKDVGEIFYSWENPVFYKDYGYVTSEDDTVFIDIDEFRSNFNSGDIINLELKFTGIDTTTLNWFSNRGYEVCVENTSDTNLKTCDMSNDILGFQFLGSSEERIDYTSFSIKYAVRTYIDRGLKELGEKYIKVSVTGLDRPLSVELNVWNYRDIEK